MAPPLLALLAIALCAASPLGARASLTDDLKSLPADASPKQACKLLIENGAVKRAGERRCRRLAARGFAAAKTVSDSGAVTIASAAACTIQALKGKLPQGQLEHCAKSVAKGARSSNTASASGFNPIDAVGDVGGAVGGAVGDLVGGVGGAIGGAVTGTLLDGFKAIINLLFGGLQSAITVALIKWMTTIPNLSGGHVGQLESSIAVGAGGLLAATMTISIVRFWSSGLTGDGAWAGAEGVARAAVAAALIGLWPPIFDLAIRLSNALQAGILGGGVQAQLKALFRDLDVIGIAGGALTGGLVPMFLAIVIAVVGIMMLLALVAMKIVITALTIVLFCAMPLAFVVWPIPELAGITRLCLRSLAVVVAIPVVWCLIFGAFAAIGADTFSFHNTGKDQGVFGTALNVTIVRPLVAIALLYLALVLPRRLLQLAPFFEGRPGVVRHIGTGMAVRAGFSYAPQVGRAALERAQTLRASAGAAGAAGAGSAGAAQRPTSAAAGAGKGTGTKEAGKAGGKTAAETLRSRTSQAVKGQEEMNRQAAPSDAVDKAAAGGAAAGKRTAGASSGAETASGRDRQSASPGSDADEKSMERGNGPFRGPRTMKLTPDRVDAIAKRRDALAADSASGTAVTREEVDGAVGDLRSRPALLEAAKKAAYHGNAEEATGAFAEWSLTDNPHVGDKHRDAFGVLGRASPSQRRTALGQIDTSGGPSSGPAGGGRRMPAAEPRSSEPTPPRTPHPQPRRDGGSSS
jgi:hypothetical protein